MENDKNKIQDNQKNLNNQIKIFNDKEPIGLEIQNKSKNKRNTIIITIIVFFLALILWIVYWQTDYYMRISRMIEYKIGNKISINDGYYQGDLNWGYFDGEGIFTFDTGSLMRGNWSDNLLQGSGEAVYSNLGTYTGTFLDSKKSGNGEFIWINGDKYIGEWLDDEINGEGNLIFSNGDIYVGNFANSNRNGKGIFTWANDVVYIGQWLDDKINGKGKITLTNGDILEGEFKNNEFLNGEYITKTDYAIYRIIINDKKINKVNIEIIDGDTYSCEYSNGNLNGDSVITYINKDQYIGNVKDGLKSGKGTYIWANGAKYEGDWQDDKINGEGAYYYAKDTEAFKLEGSFINNSPSGECIFYIKRNRYYLTTWENGKCIKITE